MRRSPVIVVSAVIALVAAVLGVLAWRADAGDTSAGPTSVSSDLAVASPDDSAPSSASVAAASTTVSPPEPLPTTTPPLTMAVESSAPPSTLTPTTADTEADATGGPPVVDGPTASCPSTDHGAIVDRESQQAWLCDDGAIVAAMPITSAWSMPDPGTYPVYAKDLNATSNFGGHFSRMTHFVAFTYGKRTGARIAFHSVPTLNDGTYVQPLDSVGEAGQRGESSGCIRVLPDDAVRIWDWLSVGDEVHVVT